MQRCDKHLSSPSHRYERKTLLEGLLLAYPLCCRHCLSSPSHSFICHFVPPPSLRNLPNRRRRLPFPCLFCCCFSSFFRRSPLQRLWSSARSTLINVHGRLIPIRVRGRGLILHSSEVNRGIQLYRPNQPTARPSLLLLAAVRPVSNHERGPFQRASHLGLNGRRCQHLSSCFVLDIEKENASCRRFSREQPVS